MKGAILYSTFLVAVSLAAPADEPIRVDLPVYDQPQAYDQPQEDSKVNQDSAFERENHPGENLNVKDVSSFANKIPVLHTLSDNSLGGIFSAPVTSREDAILESEGLGSKILSFKEGVQGAAAGIFQPKPIVDTIREEEKYGNTGDKFYSAGRSIVNGASSLSTFVNGLLEVPGNIFKQVTRSATEKLNQIGGKLIGL